MFKRIVQRLGARAATRPAVGDGDAEQPSAGAVEPMHPEFITAYDVHGREVRVARTQWRDQMLMPQLQAKWDEPDALYGLILNALDDGFVAEVEPASRQLRDTDPILERGHVIHAIVLMKLGLLDAAERVLLEAVARCGETGTLLTNLAKVCDARGDQPGADGLLWKAITLDPNQDNGLGWWAAREHERGGATAYVAALERAAALPGSWRATLWLGRHRLGEGEVDAAIELFGSVLEPAASDPDALLTISGDLGNADRIEAMLELVGPHYKPATHSPQVGLNLLQACLHLGRLDEGEALLERLYALQMPPFKQHLDEMAGRFQALRGEASPPRPVQADALQVSHLPFDRPIWMFGLRDPDWLFAAKPGNARTVMFLPLGKVSGGSQQAEEQREDELGRLSRAIPLYLAESAYEWTPLRAQTLLPVVMGGGPVVFGAQDEAGQCEAAAQLAAHAGLLVQGSIAEREGRWTIELAVWDTAKLEATARESVSADHDGLAAAVLALEQKLLAHLGGAQVAPHDGIYTRPDAAQMQPYLAGLAQSLMLGLVASDVVPRAAMWGERSMIEWPLKMALHWPGYQVPRAMYLAGLSHAARYGSEVLAEFEARSLDLVRDMEAERSPLAGLVPLCLHAFRRTDAIAAHRSMLRDARRLAWLDRVEAANASAEAAGD